MANPFDVLNDTEKTDDRYLDRVEFFLSLKEPLTKEGSTRSVARDETKKLLKSKNVTTAKLRTNLGGRSQKAPNIAKNYSDSAQAVAKRKSNVTSAEIKKPKADAKVVNANTPSVAQANKTKLKKLLAKKA